MIDYKDWAKEYEEQAERLLHRANELKVRKETENLSLDKIHDLNERITILVNRYHEHRLIAKHLRGKGKDK